MQKSVRFLVSVLLLGAYLLSACTGVAPQSAGSGGKVQAKEVVFTGVVEATGASEWTVSGQKITLDSATAIDPNVKVGDIVRVEANVSQDGAVVAMKIESSGPDDAGANTNDTNSNSANDNGTNSNDNANVNDNSNANSNANSNDNGNANSNGATGMEQEFMGTVQAITTQSITINGITYSLAQFTEFKGAIAVGDQVKIHVIANADGTLTIREIEKTSGGAIGDDNGNGNGNSNDDNGNSNSNDDHGGSGGGNDNGGGGGGNGNDDNGGSGGSGGGGNSNDND